MADQYEPRDLAFNKVKTIFQSELLGPNLKRLDENKKLNDAT